MLNKDKNSKVVYQTSNLADLRHLFSNEDEHNDVKPLLPNEQNLGVRLEKKGRGGKSATLIKGFQGSNEELQTLAKKLKQHCGVGGSANNSEILIQGNQVQKVISFLLNEGYKVKKIGG